MRNKRRKQSLQAIDSLPPPIIHRPTSTKKKASTKGSWVNSLLAIALISAGVSLIAGGTWLGLQLFIHPNAVIGINKFLPRWAQIPVVESEDAPQTLKQIQTHLRQQGQSPGEPLTLETQPKTLIAQTLVVPIFNQKANCQSDCQEIVELRLYQLTINNLRNPLQPAENTYQLISQLPVVGPEESFTIAPIVDPDTPNYGSTKLLPLTQLQRFVGIAPPGVWLYLMGQRQQATNAIAYGHILHYSPNSKELALALTWTSPTGQIPKWQQLTGGGSPELIVDRTSDLEPQLQVYQAKPAQDAQDNYQLVPISLEPPAIKTRAYINAIFLARNGLWTPAWQWLKFIKQQRRGISATAQAQIDLVGLYAKYTQKQAQSAWASPSQEVLANLIDGRWQKALQVFQASPENTQEVATLLVNDSGRLWNRVDAALQVNPNRLEVQTWGALILGAQEGHQNAIAWFKHQPQATPKNLVYIDKLLKRLDGDYSDNHPLQNRTSRIIGYAEAIANPNLADWLQLDKLTSNLPTEQWQQIQVVAYHDGKRWQRQPFTALQLPEKDPAKYIWKQLGLDIDPRIELVIKLPDGQQQTIASTVKAVQLQGGALRLLTATEGTVAVKSEPTLALSTEAVQWIEPVPITLKEFIQQESLDATQFLPNIWRELRKTQPSLDREVPNFEKLQQQLGQLPVQLIDLTGDGNSEIVLTISPQAINSWTKTDKSVSTQPSPNRTMIFASTGDLIYSEFSNATGTIKAIADLQDTAPPALLIEKSGKYNIQRWSTLNQRFE